MKKITLTIAAIAAVFTMNAQQFLDANGGYNFTPQSNNGGNVTMAVPNPTANPTPADGATDVYVFGTIGQNQQGQPVSTYAVALSWEAATSGDEPTAYDVVFNGNVLGTLNPNEGETTPPTSVNITGVGLGSENTWQIIAKNADGSATGSEEWSFTVITEEDISVAPEAVTEAIVPEDTATDVAIESVDNNGTPEPAVLMAYSAAQTGAPATSYELFIGTSETDLQSAGEAPGLIRYFFGAQYNTTYYWKLVAKNNAGDAPDSPVWSFTTEPDASVNNVTENTFKHYINNNVLTIEANTAIENIRIFNILGQQVATQDISAQQTEVNVSSFKAGVYLAQVQIAGKTQTFKFIKK
ncbi:T9SS type A sorting domain-containing protein [Mesonia aquimarina]|uniref:T9SS type A sorting domain-containing protein n=1 Tax=Mesonia aquimarina TaxID=1504967 RepID=UPI000EF5FFC0|nr:T9SS type A sorting domain-containing protein [Mesonia aquimarina]